MATQRYVSTSFWTDPWVLDELTSDERYLYLYLLTAPNSNIAGVFELSIREAELHTGFDRDQLIRIFNRFEEAGKAYYHERYVIIPKWPRHQRYEGRQNVKQGILKILSKIPSGVWDKLQEIEYEFPLTEVQRGWNPPGTPQEPPCNTHETGNDSHYTDTDTDTDTDRKADTTHPSLNVRMNQAHYDRLVREYGKQTVDDYIGRAINWVESKGKRPYRDYAAAADNWLKRDKVTKIRAPSKPAVDFSHVGGAS